MSNPMDMIFSRQGLSIYGGLVVGAIAGAIFLRKHSAPLLPMLDALAPALILSYGIGRIGCQVSGDGHCREYGPEACFSTRLVLGTEVSK